MFRRTCVALCAALIALVMATSVAALPAAAYEPSAGAHFNNPGGTRAAKNRLHTYVRQAINHTPRGQTILLASYSFDRPDIADALIRAHRRGVNVRVVLNDNWTSLQTRRMQRVMGRNIARRSFVKVCFRACRGGYGNQHMKFFVFTKTGRAANVVMVGSSNPTGFAAKTHWNDLYTVKGSASMVRVYTQVFGELARDRNMRHSYRVSHHGILTSVFYPKRGTRRATDPVMRRLNNVTCRAARGHGIRGHTTIRIVMYGWQRTRGVYLANKVVQLRRRGCNVRALLSSGGGNVARILKRGGVRARSADLDFRPGGFNDTPWDRFVHEKWMAVSGGYAGRQGHHVWTGSENWSNISFINDEVTLHIPRWRAYRQYVRNFNFIWARGSRPFRF
jgi:phosphatidylserine/phosphatidylglycerophosphate/cardiolipin synthase-like enzyme